MFFTLEFISEIADYSVMQYKLLHLFGVITIHDLVTVEGGQNYHSDMHFWALLTNGLHYKSVLL